MQYDDREEVVSLNYVSSERFVLIEVFLLRKERRPATTVRLEKARSHACLLVSGAIKNVLEARWRQRGRIPVVTSQRH
jgi:hypothetical protein